MQGLAQLSARAASVKHSGGLRNPNLSKGYSPSRAQRRVASLTVLRDLVICDLTGT